MLLPAVFPDCDGSINYNHGYVHNRKHFNFIVGAFDLACKTHQHHYKIITITNQLGTAAVIGANLLFVVGHPNKLGGLNHVLITTLLEAISYLQRGMQ